MAKKYKIDLADVATFCGKDVIHRNDVEEFLARGTEAPESVAETTVCVAVGSADLADRVALVTGGSGGIGAAIASNLAVAGATVIVHCNANMQSAETVATAIRAAGGKAQVAQADLTDPDQCRRLVEGIVSEHGQLDILINNAGILADSVVSFMSDAQWEKVLAVNLSAPFYLTRAVAMEMARRRWGRIINIASDAGRLGSANRANYAAAKEGLVGFTRSVAREMAGMGVRVNAISPGFVETAMTAEIKDVKRKELLRAIPVRRFGRPEDVAELALFLASDRADYITGQVISVDGGLFMG
ncbi:MAG: 3-oxoacyl-ACP reductase FabG [Lentisphaeria bacterium]|nr:3-oxoacyl-ACP reductase FabG [Lentisphaeria bacterium]